MRVDQELRVLEAKLKHLIREWERFFAGDRKTPPAKERADLERRFRVLTEKPSARRVVQYRFEQLQHRFQTYAQMWERMLREREEGRRAFPLQRPGAPPPAPPAEPQQQPAQATAERPNTPRPASVSEGDAALFERYVTARQQAGQSARLDQKAFLSQIDSQRQKLEAKLGCKVRFEVVVEGDKVKLAARKVAK